MTNIKVQLLMCNQPVTGTVLAYSERQQGKVRLEMVHIWLDEPFIYPHGPAKGHVFHRVCRRPKSITLLTS